MWIELDVEAFNDVQYVNTINAARYLGISEITLKRHAAAGLIRPDMALAGRNRYSRATLDAYRPSLKRRGGQPGKRSKR